MTNYYGQYTPGQPPQPAPTPDRSGNMPPGYWMMAARAHQAQQEGVEYQRQAAEYQRQQLNLLRAHQGLPPIPSPAELQQLNTRANRFAGMFAAPLRDYLRQEKVDDLRRQGRRWAAAWASGPYVGWSVTGDPTPEKVIWWWEDKKVTARVPQDDAEFGERAKELLNRWIKGAAKSEAPLTTPELGAA